MVFHRSLSDSKSPQVSRTLLRILAVLNNAVVWTVSSRPPTSKSSSLFSNHSVSVFIIIISSSSSIFIVTIRMIIIITIRAFSFFQM